MKYKKNYIDKEQRIVNREISWLSFNERVLQEAMDERVPLIERVRFLGIYSNNTDEFFRVRVATVKRMIGIKGPEIEGFKAGPEKLLDVIQAEVVRLQTKFEQTYQQIISELSKKGVHLVDDQTCLEKYLAALKEYFIEKVRAEIVPIMLEKKNAFPRLPDKGIYLAIKMIQQEKNKVKYALIEIPSTISRFKVLPSDGDEKYLILLDDIIRLNLQEVFHIFKVDEIRAYTFKFTRDAELDFDDDISTSLMEKMERSIERRKKGEPVRFVYDASMPDDLLSFLMKGLNLKEGENIIPGGKYHNFKDFMSFPSIGKENLRYKSLPPTPHPLLYKKKSLIKEIYQKDFFLNYPYQKFTHIVDLLREAAIDPKVKSIKINLYRVARRSQIINALINAAKNGKEVIVVVELLARFDEENNIYWSNILKENGVKIIFGVPNLKVHSKLILITRVSNRKKQLIAHIGTGNFHEGTAKVYGDCSLLTGNVKLTKEVEKLFKFFENNIERGLFRHLLVSPFNTRRKFLSLIQNEIKAAKKEKEASIILKINNLVDFKMIEKLYEASNAGVKIKLIIRGICSLIPGVIGMSENIQVISIVDRFLEHARIAVFHNGGKKLYFISSADWMSRNLDHRIEVTAPIYDDNIQRIIKKMLDFQWSDNQKARTIEKNKVNDYVKPKDGEDLIRSQIVTYEYFKEKFEKVVSSEEVV